MHEQYKKEFVKYLKPAGMWPLILSGSYVLIFSAVVIYTNIPRILLLFWAAFGLLMLVLGLSQLRDYPAYIRSLEQSGYFPQILQDYAQAESAMHGRLRFGKYYLYAMGQGKLISYQNLVRIYTEAHKGRRTMWYTDREGKGGMLCELAPINSLDVEELRVVKMLRSRNPSLQVD